MAHYGFNKVTMTFIIALVLGCFIGSDGKAAVTFEAKKLAQNQYTQLVDDYVVILDASESMKEFVDDDETKLAVAKNFVKAMQETLPDIWYTSGLRTFGWWNNNKDINSDTFLLYWNVGQSRAGLLQALATVTSAGGNSHLDLAIDETSDNLVGTRQQPAFDPRWLSNVGRDATDYSFKSPRNGITVIIVSDGVYSDGNAIIAATNIKTRYQQDLKIFCVVVGDNEEAKATLDKIAAIGGGFAVSANALTSNANMVGFLEKTLLAKDQDGDGVADASDKCPDTKKDVLANPDGCTPDTDGDGVYDYLDRCPRTPHGLKVDKMGCPSDVDADGEYDDYDRCPKTAAWINNFRYGCPSENRSILFDVAKYQIMPWMYTLLDEYVAALKKNPETRLQIIGHTDDVGSAESNVKLSKMRINAVVEYFTRAGVDAKQLVPSFLGEQQPAAPNGTPAGRSMNRRVEFKMIQ